MQIKLDTAKAKGELTVTRSGADELTFTTDPTKPGKKYFTLNEKKYQVRITIHRSLETREFNPITNTYRTLKESEQHYQYSFSDWGFTLIDSQNFHGSKVQGNSLFKALLSHAGLHKLFADEELAFACYSDQLKERIERMTKKELDKVKDLKEHREKLLAAKKALAKKDIPAIELALKSYY